MYKQLRYYNLELTKNENEIYLNFWKPENGNDRVFVLREDGVYEKKEPLSTGDHYEPVNLREELIKMAKDL